MSEEKEFLDQMRRLGVKPLDPHKVEPVPQVPKKLVLGSAKPKRPAQEPPPTPPKPKFSGPQPHPVSTRPKRLTRDFEPDLVVDLHGMVQAEALKTTRNVLAGAYNKGYDHVLLITGKGLNSEVEGGVLPKAVWQWLEVEAESFVAEFELAPPFLGGTGAILVFFFR